MSWRMHNGGNQWSGWAAYLSFFRHVSQLPLDYSKWQHYEAAAELGGPRYMHEEFCIVSERPEVLTVDARNRPHSDSGPFCRWRDGSALYSVHGVRVPWWVIEQPELLTPKRIDEERNAEVRRLMIERLGAERYLLEGGSVKVHEDDCGELYRKELAGDEPLVMVRVVNSTPEPDGSRKKYMLRVPPTVQTAREAVAWTFDMPPEQYRPELET